VAADSDRQRLAETGALTLREAQSPYKAGEWLRLTPAERLRRSWALRSRLPDLRAVHDRKLFPKP
jgi:hypothetical protein